VNKIFCTMLILLGCQVSISSVCFSGARFLKIGVGQSSKAGLALFRRDNTWVKVLLRRKVKRIIERD